MKLNNLSLDRRYGSFLMDGAFLKNEPEVALLVMKNFLVTWAAYDMCRQGIEYKAMSHLFDVCPGGHRAPEYEIIVTRLDDVVIDVIAERIN